MGEKKKNNNNNGEKKDTKPDNKSEKKADDKKTKEKKKNNNNNGEKKDTKPDNKSEKKADDKKTKEPPVTTAVLKVAMDCQGCVDTIRKIVSETKGVHKMGMDKEKETVTVKGTMNVKDLVKNLTKGVKRNVEVVSSKKDNGGGREKNNKGVGGGDNNNRKSEIVNKREIKRVHIKVVEICVEKESVRLVKQK